MQPNWLRPRPGPGSAHVRPFGNDGDSCHCSYYINYLTKAMQLEDPRGGGRNYKQLQNERCSTESIALQVSRIEAMQLHLIGKLTECVSLAAFTAQFTSQFPLPRGASEQQFDGRACFPGAGETAACTAQSVDQPTAVGLVTWTIGRQQQPCTLTWFHPLPLSLCPTGNVLAAAFSARPFGLEHVASLHHSGDLVLAANRYACCGYQDTEHVPHCR